MSDSLRMDYSPPASSVHGILQGRILEWAAITHFSRSSQPKHQTWVSCIAGRFFTIWVTKEALLKHYLFYSNQFSSDQQICVYWGWPKSSFSLWKMIWKTQTNFWPTYDYLRKHNTISRQSLLLFPINIFQKYAFFSLYNVQFSCNFYVLNPFHRLQILSVLISFSTNILCIKKDK